MRNLGRAVSQFVDSGKECDEFLTTLRVVVEAPEQKAIQGSRTGKICGVPWSERWDKEDVKWCQEEEEECIPGDQETEAGIEEDEKDVSGCKEE